MPSPTTLRLANPYGAFKARELRDNPPPPRDWVVEQLLATGLSLFAAKAKAGKSWWCLQFGYAVSTGTPFLGFQVVRPRRVVYFACEDDDTQLYERLESLGLLDSLPDNLTLITQDSLEKAGKYSIDLAQEAGRNELLTFVEEQGFEVVIIDPLNRAFSMDQNKNEEVQPALAPLQRYARTHNIAIVITDHHKKGVLREARDLIEDPGGARAKSTVPDIIFGLYKNAKNDWEMVKGGRIGREISLNLTLAADPDDPNRCQGWMLNPDKPSPDLAWTPGPLPPEKEPNYTDKIILALQQYGPMTSASLIQVVGFDKANTAYKTLERMEKDGRLGIDWRQNDAGQFVKFFCLPNLVQEAA